MDYSAIKTPAYVVHEDLIRKNCEILRYVEEQTGAHILLAQKAFSMYALYPLIGEYISGATASGLHEAKLGYEEMGKENHIFSPAYRPEEMDEILEICDHVIFNSFNQWEKYRDKALARGRSCGIRINPECSTQEHGIYDPCAYGSRIGVTAENFREDLLDGIEGLHFHTLCEQNSDDLETTLKAVEGKFGKYMHRMKWINFGGGHHITRADYDVELLIRLIRHVRETYDVEVYLEPGEAVALNAGFLVTTVMELVENGNRIAILDASAACHMPDVLEMPYRPVIIQPNGDTAGEPNEKSVTVRLGGNTCLAGDVIGDYSFDEPLKGGERLVFGDMAIYSMCKNNTFNGMPLPSIYLLKESGEVELIKKFGYEDFKGRLS